MAKVWSKRALRNYQVREKPSGRKERHSILEECLKKDSITYNSQQLAK